MVIYMLENIKDLKEVLRNMINEEIGNLKGLDIYVVTGVNSDLTFNIKQLSRNKSYDNVEIVSQGLGNGSGFIFYPTVNSVVLVGFITNSERPIILGNMFDIYSNTKDSKMTIKQNEVLLMNKTNGAYIFINENNTIKIKEPNGEYVLIDSNGLTSSNYNSSDGTAGATADVTVRDAAGTGTTTLHFKNGIFTGAT